MLSAKLGLPTAYLLALLSPACNTCDREGCDALQVRAAANGTTRVAGVVASESDVVSNGCQECGVAGGVEVKAWAVERAVTTDDEVLSATSGTPAATVSTSGAGQYALELEAGRYLVCVHISCFNASVDEASTTTLNVRLINGISRGFLAENGAQALQQQDALFRAPG